MCEGFGLRVRIAKLQACEVQFFFFFFFFFFLRGASTRTLERFQGYDVCECVWQGALEG